MKKRVSQVLWLGDDAHRVVDKLLDEIASIDIIVSEDEMLQGSLIDDIPVCSPEILNTSYQRSFVMIYSNKYDEIKGKLQAWGYKEYSDFKSVNSRTGDPVARHGYYSSYQEEDIYDVIKPSVKAIAFYLPQFHCFPENDEWWGEGFTEWTNTKKAKPIYENHYQPRIPHKDIGYYNLLDVNVIRKQAELAKRHGIFGFCFYYYWFSGKRLMEKPLDILLNHPEIDINYCMCWANENWTRRWDGLDQEILIAQEYMDDDPEKFMLDIKKYMMDKRYIRVDGKPIIIVYELGKIPKVRRVIKKWKMAAQKCGIGEILVWATRCSGNTAKSLGVDDLIDMEIEFPPRDVSEMQNEPVSFKGVEGYNGLTFDYTALVDSILSSRKQLKEKIYRTVMLGWDNTPRIKNGLFNSADNFDIKKYYDWLKANVEETEKVFEPEKRFVFINAWNEWGEGTYLEPDEKYGYASINTTSRAITKRNFSMEFEVKPILAVQAHVFHVDLFGEIIEYTNRISEPFDLYITTDTCRKAGVIGDAVKLSKAAHYYINVMDNRGRDVMPFLLQMNGCYAKYKYLLHLHTKKTKHLVWNKEWRTYLFQSLLPSCEGVEHILNRFKTDDKLGVLYPTHYKKLKPFITTSDGDRKEIIKLLRKLRVKDGKLDKSEFPSGNMFWARVEAVRQMFANDLVYEDFPPELGQVDCTVMHAIERCWCKVAAFNGYKSETI